MLSRGLHSDKPVAASTNPDRHFEVAQPPDNSVLAMTFSPATVQQDFLIASSWDASVRCWEVEQSGNTVPKSKQSMISLILDVCWSDDSTKVFMASCDKLLKCWNLGSNQIMQVAAHDAPIKTCHWVKAPSYTCIMTGSWDKTLKFWDVRSSVLMMTINLPQKVYCADVDYPMAVVGTASRGIFVYKLEGKPEMVKSVDSLLKYQHRCVAIFKDKTTQFPTGFGLGSVEGRVTIHNVQTQCPNQNFTFKCHRQDNWKYVNDIKFHPVHGTLVTVGSDTSLAYWDKDAHAKLKVKTLDQPIKKCCFNSNGQILAYSTGCDFSNGHEHNNPAKKPQIFLKPCFNDLKPKSST